MKISGGGRCNVTHHCFDPKTLSEKYPRGSKELRAALSEETIEDKSIAIANNALQLDIWNYEYYHIFLPIVKQKEVDMSVVCASHQNQRQ